MKQRQLSLIFLVVFIGIIFYIGFQELKHLIPYKPENEVSTLQNEIILAAKYFSSEKRHYWGYINEKGEVLYNFVFNEASIFHKELGMSFVITKDSKVAILNSDFQIIDEIDGQDIEAIGGFNIEYYKKFEDFVSVKLNGKWGYINKDCEIVIEPLFDKAFDFENGFAEVWYDEDDEIKSAVINTRGEFVLEPTPYEKVSLGYYNLYNGYGYEENNKWGFKNFDGTIVIKPEFDFVMPIADNIVILALGDKVGFLNIETGFESGFLYEYKDENGGYLFPDYAGNNSMRFYEKDDSNEGYIVKLVNFDNETLVSFKTQHANYKLPSYYQEFMPFQTGEKWGYIDGSRRNVLWSKYEYAGYFDKMGYALVSTDLGNDDYFFINKKGFRVSPYFHYEPTYGSLSEVGYIGGTMLDGSQAVFDANFNMIWKSR